MKTTPWITTEELEETGNNLLISLCLFPNNNEIRKDAYYSIRKRNNKKLKASMFSSRSNEIVAISLYESLSKAIDRVSIWRHRSSNSQLPHSIETTANLAELLLCDYKECSSHNNDNNIKSSLQQLRLAYSSGITRGINGFADAFASERGLYSSSVSTLCDNVGIPSWIVDIRHDASHNELPSLPVLRLASKNLLDYIQRVYWDNISDSLSECKFDSKKILISYLESSNPLQCAQEYIKKVTIDVGLPVCIQFITQQLSCASKSTSKLEDYFFHIHKHYHVLFYTIQESWSGFSSALLENLVHSYLKFEDTPMVQNLIQYLLSRYWLSYIVSYLKSDISTYFKMDSLSNIASQVKVLRRKQISEWTEAEKEIMTAPASSSLLIEVYNLNSLRDWCQCQSKSDQGQALITYLESVIGPKNMCDKLYGLPTYWLLHWSSNSISTIDQEKSDKFLLLEKNECQGNVNCENVETSKNKKLLENMEAILDIDPMKEIDGKKNNCVQEVEKYSCIGMEGKEIMNRWNICNEWSMCPLGKM